MTEKKITVELDEDEARALVRVGPADDDGRANVFHARNAIDKIAAALPPEYPEGTVAWVTEVYDLAPEERRYLAVYIDGQWYDGPAMTTLLDAVKVEPLRVLADDEIAVKRVTDDIPTYYVRRWAKHLRAEGNDGMAEVIEAYVAGLEAEAK